MPVTATLGTHQPTVALRVDDDVETQHRVNLDQRVDPVTPVSADTVAVPAVGAHINGGVLGATGPVLPAVPEERVGGCGAGEDTGHGDREATSGGGSCGYLPERDTWCGMPSHRFGPFACPSQGAAGLGDSTQVINMWLRCDTPNGHSVTVSGGRGPGQATVLGDQVVGISPVVDHKGRRAVGGAGGRCGPTTGRMHVQ
jgi:hypothetical protein